MTISSDSPLLQIDSLSVHFSIERGLLRRKVGEVRAVDGVSLDIHPGETLGLVGESGCGKTTLGRTVVKLQSATGGEVLFDREPISEKNSDRPRRPAHLSGSIQLTQSEDDRR